MRLYRTYVKIRSGYKPAFNERRIFERKPHSDREVNARGFRDREHADEKPKDVYRIVVLGDSVTDGYGVNFDDRYAIRLEALLNRGGRKYEVISLALNQYSTVQEVELLKEVGLGLSPDLVIVAYVLNDPCPDGSIVRFFRQEGATSLALHWITAELKRALIKPQAPERLPGCRSFDYYSELHCDSAMWAEVQGALTEVHDLSRKHDFRVLLVVFPVLAKEPDASFSDYLWRSVHAQVLEEAGRQQFDTLDLLPSFAVRRPVDLKREAGDQLHPNALGNEIAASAIYGKLLDLGIATNGADR